MSESDDLRLKRLEKNQEKIIEGLKSLHTGLRKLHKKVDGVASDAGEAASRQEYDDTDVHNMLEDVRYEVGELFGRFIGERDKGDVDE